MDVAVSFLKSIRLIFMFIFFTYIFAFNVSLTYASSVTLSWNRNQEPDIAGYQIFWGLESGRYSNRVTISDTATQPLKRSYTISGLQEGKTYYFALKAIDRAGQIGPFSSEIAYHIYSQNSSALVQNYVLNSSVEQGNGIPDGWRIYDWVPSGKRANDSPGGWSSDESHSGTYSLMITNGTGSQVAWRGEEVSFAYPYPHVLTFGGWSKAESVGDGCWIYGLVFKVIFSDGGYEWFYPDAIQFDRGTHGWQLRQVTKKWDKGVAAVVPYAVLYNDTGTAWFDDIFVIPNPESVIFNSSMEFGEGNSHGWRIYDWVPSGKRANDSPGGWSSDESHSGTYSLMITNGTGSQVAWRGEEVSFAYPYPHVLTFGGWSKAESVGDGCWIYGLVFKVIFSDGGYEWFYPDAIQFDRGTHGWQLRQVTKKWSKGIKSVTPFAVVYDGTGTAWFDDIFVKILE